MEHLFLVDYGTLLCAGFALCIVFTERMLQEVSVGMNEGSRGAWVLMAAFGLLVSMGMSWRLLPLRDLPESGRQVREAPGLLMAVSQRPEFAFGFRNVLADVVWLQAVQVAGNRKLTPSEYDHLYFLLNVEADLDPKFEIPYLFGGLVLGESPKHGREALRVFERGKVTHPTDWRFPFYMGFTHYFSLGDAVAGGEAMAESARLPGSPPYLPGLASRMLSEAREPEVALALLAPIVLQESDPARRAVLERRIREVSVERDLQALEKAVETYREKTGTVPESLPELVREGILEGIPQEPNGGRYVIDRGGKVRSDRVAQRLQVFQQR